MSANDARKQSLYFPEDMLNEIQSQAQRLDRSLSWVVQQAWKIAKSELRKVPSPNDML
ncbi:MAG: TIGR04563 family protein, partial [Deltaproteobacteria bacterium]